MLTFFFVLFFFLISSFNIFFNGFVVFIDLFFHLIIPISWLIIHDAHVIWIYLMSKSRVSCVNSTVSMTIFFRNIICYYYCCLIFFIILLNWSRFNIIIKFLLLFKKHNCLLNHFFLVREFLNLAHDITWATNLVIFTKRITKRIRIKSQLLHC
jgi:hypothetical protein